MLFARRLAADGDPQLWLGPQAVLPLDWLSPEGDLGDESLPGAM